MEKEAIELVKILTYKNLHVSCAESCTGGMVASMITAVPGSSEIFDGSVVTYANRIKEKLVNVKNETLDTHGAVSAECAREMAQGVRLLMDADIGVSLTGIAGPGGAVPGKPVGTVYMGISTKNETISTLLRLSGDRDEVRHAASLCALRAAADAANNL